MTEHTTNAAEELDYALRSALRFAASRSAITAEQERGILAAFDRPTQADNVLREAARCLVDNASHHGDHASVHQEHVDCLRDALGEAPTHDDVAADLQEGRPMDAAMRATLAKPCPTEKGDFKMNRCEVCGGTDPAINTRTVFEDDQPTSCWGKFHTGPDSRDAWEASEAKRLARKRGTSEDKPFEVRPCVDANGNRTSWDICYPPEPGATGVGVVASCYGTREQASAMAVALELPEALAACELLIRVLGRDSELAMKVADAARALVTKARGDA